MKTTLFIVLIGVLTVWSCAKDKEDQSGDLRLSGTISKIEHATTFQYGSHLLHTSDSTFALFSNTLDLDLYLSVPVTVTVKVVEGYPVENGPVFLEVIAVTR
jgi:hypothetical protein